MVMAHASQWAITVANQLETVGFTVDRQYKTSSEAFPIWLGTAAADGQWHIYTAGYTPGGFPRDERAQLQQSYLNTSIQASEPFISNVSDAEFQQLGDDLAQGNFSTKEERDEMMRRAPGTVFGRLPFCMDDRAAELCTLCNDNVQVTYDLALDYEAASVGPYNLRFIDQEGGVREDRHERPLYAAVEYCCRQ